MNLEVLRCPDCHGPFVPRATVLLCTVCNAEWSLREGIPVLYREPWVQGPDKLLRYFYDGVPRLHDPLVRYGLPIWQLGGTEADARRRYMKHLRLEELQPGPEPVRFLEVSVGSGASIGLVRQAASAVPDMAYWGLDLSWGMMNLARARIRKTRQPAVEWVQGDAHALPFADGVFDRVLHVGGIGGFRDPAKALAEMCRVAKPGAPIVVVDEQLDPHRKNGLWPTLWFRAVTFYDDRPHCPTEALPPGVTDVVEEQVSRFYYCLSFRAPAKT